MSTKIDLEVLSDIDPGMTPSPWEFTLTSDGTFAVYGVTPQDRIVDAGLVAYGIRHVDDAEFITTARRVMPALLQAAAALPKLIELVLDMGHTIRHMDDMGDTPEYWTNDADGAGEYIPEERFAAAQAALALLQGEGV